MTGTLFFSSHDKRLRRGNDAAKRNITLRQLAKAWPGRSRTRGAIRDERRGSGDRYEQSASRSTSFLRTKGAT
jgi:hypothetical protein